VPAYSSEIRQSLQNENAEKYVDDFGREAFEVSYGGDFVTSGTLLVTAIVQRTLPLKRIDRLDDIGSLVWGTPG